MKSDRCSCEHNLCNPVTNPKKKFRTSAGFEPLTLRYQLSHEATEVGSWLIMCSYVSVKEMNLIDVYKSYKNCEDHSSFDFISAVLK